MEKLSVEEVKNHPDYNRIINEARNSFPNGLGVGDLMKNPVFVHHHQDMENFLNSIWWIRKDFVKALGDYYRNKSTII